MTDEQQWKQDFTLMAHYRDALIDISNVIVRCYGGVDGFQFHLSPDQAESLAGMLREAAREIRRNELLSKTE